MPQNVEDGFRGSFIGTAAAAAVVFAMSQAQWRFAAPDELAAIATLFGMALVFWYGAFVAAERRVGAALCMLIAVLSGGYGVYRYGELIVAASAAALANDKRCLAIQRDMLSARPRIADGPDKFQALGCRPQGTDTRIFVAPTNRERAAGKPLPWGGYPPPR